MNSQKLVFSEAPLTPPDNLSYQYAGLHIFVHSVPSEVGARDITHPAENAVSILLGDGHGAFHPMSGSPLPLADCRGPNSVAAGDLTGDGTQSIVVACAESRTMLIYHRGAAGKFTSTTVPIAGGWGSVAIASLAADPRQAILTANSDAGSITIYFPD
jgi:hypothetical protein